MAVESLSHIASISPVIESDTMIEARNLNQPPLKLEKVESGNFRLPFYFDSKQVSVEALKKAENEDTLIVRLLENFGKKAKIRIDFSTSVKSIFETDLMENNKNNIDLNGKSIELHFTAFEIKTLKIVI